MTSRREALISLAGFGASLLLARVAKAQSVAYTYDVFGRVTSVTYPNGSVTTYTYDNADNRTAKTHSASPPPPPPPPPLSVSLSGTQWSGGPDGDEDPPLDAVATGGVPPYSYAWVRVSGNTATAAATPTAASCRWIYQIPRSGPDKLSYWRCDVTDQASAVVSSGQVTVRMRMS